MALNLTQDLIENNKRAWKPGNHPLDAPTAFGWLTNKEEQEFTRMHLEKVWWDIDQEMRPYLVRLLDSGSIVTVYSCWGHREKGNKGNLLFRSFLPLQEVYEQIWFPLQQRLDPGITTEGVKGKWQWVTLEVKNWYWHNKIGYLIEWQHLSEDDKHLLMRSVCDICL